MVYVNMYSKGYLITIIYIAVITTSSFSVGSSWKCVVEDIQSQDTITLSVLINAYINIGTPLLSNLNHHNEKIT